MPNPLENLSGFGKSLKKEAPDPSEYEGLLYLDERLVTDLITATQAVADALQGKLP